MANANNFTLAIVLVIGLTISQFCSAALSPDLKKQLQDPNKDPNRPLSDLLAPPTNSGNPPADNPVTPPVDTPVTPTPPVNNPVTPPVENKVTPPVDNVAKEPVNMGSTPDIIQDDPNLFLASQNAARAKVGVQPYVWNESLAEFARSYAQERAADCKLQHSHAPNKGENIARSPGVLSPEKAIKMWLDEEPLFDTATGKCKGGVCGHYTQVVWRDSTSIGCARSNCHAGEKKGTFVTCNYYPPGNKIGHRPY